jgi:hypothetical protein
MQSVEDQEGSEGIMRRWDDIISVQSRIKNMEGHDYVSDDT